MRYRTPSRSKIQVSIGLILTALLVCVAGGWMPGRLWRILSPPSEVQFGYSPLEIYGTPASTEELAKAANSPRVYGHSLVPGGIHSVGELIALMLSDPLLADHYKSFDLTRTHFIVVEHDVTAYVSYRLAQKIYWSSHQTVIRKGELVLTDGSSFIRARCGNRISHIPGFPTNPEEPTDMDIVQDLKQPEDPPPNLASPPVPIALNPLPSVPVFVPLLPWLPPLCCGAVPPPPQNRPPVIRADEFFAVHFNILGRAVRIPSEFASLAVGILLILCLRSFVRRSKRKLPTTN